jgi:peptidase C13-like protein
MTITILPTLVRIRQLVAMALRAAIWRRTPEPPVLGLGAVIGWALLTIAVELVVALVNAGANPQFDLYGINALIAWRATLLLVGVVFAPAMYRATLLSASLALSVFVGILTALTPLALSHLPTIDLEKVWGIEARYSGGALTTLYLIWTFGAIFALFRSVVAGGRWNKLSRAAGYFVATFLITWGFPHLPVFAPPDFPLASANVWEAKRAAAIEQIRSQRPQIDAGQVALAQPALLDTALSRLVVPRDHAAHIFTIGVAGFSAEDVFIKELNGALGSLGQVLPIEGRTLRLVNHVSLVNAAPLASLQNFAAAIHGIGKLMNKDDDILLLFMTSHGSADGFALLMEGVDRSTLRPDELASVLDDEGIKNRIVIVSACYSGIFLKPLMSDNAIVLTASDENSSSFGCSNERDWTYFGDALFNHALHPGATLQQAFDQAKQMIAGLEAEGKLPASNPQAWFGSALVEKLRPLYLQAETSPFPAVPGPRK